MYTLTYGNATTSHIKNANCIIYIYRKKDGNREGFSFGNASSDTLHTLPLLVVPTSPLHALHDGPKCRARLGLLGPAGFRDIRDINGRITRQSIF